jgi:hypothetical protein
VVGILTAAALLYVALLLAERRAVEPILPLDLFRNRVFAADAALSLLTLMAVLGMAFYVPLFLQGVLGASAAQSGATMTPFSVSIAAAGSLAGVVITALQRYQVVAILGALLMTAGIVLLTRMTPATGPVQAAIFVATAGLGMGALLSVVGMVALNTVPPTHLGAGSAAVRYVGQIGGTVGVAIVGTVVNLSLANDLDRRLPAAAVTHLATEGVTVVTTPQVLVDPTYRATAMRVAVRAIAAHVPAGPHHAQLMAAATRQVQHLLTQVFEALRLSLAVAIQHGLVTVLVFCGAAVLVTFVVTDIPMLPRPGSSPDEEGAAPERADSLPVPPS